MPTEGHAKLNPHINAENEPPTKNRLPLTSAALLHTAKTPSCVSTTQLRDPGFLHWSKYTALGCHEEATLELFTFLADEDDASLRKQTTKETIMSRKTPKKS
eukprot:TRINITY_DN696_c0_g1_i1.p1 TRINITY_DN696_c0_g1~~TRINITY_DN696_c0_g1_i1.p1  ORF type:complete len:102 (+),score=7.40 TRINITY_DN696_c0_g1_i1:472-777(+)